MENKRLYKKLDTYFWFFMMSLPILFVLIAFIFAFITGKNMVSETGTVYYSSFRDIIDSFYDYQDAIINFFDNFNFSFISDMFSSIFTHDIIAVDSENYYYLYTICGYWVSLGFIHLIVDIILWLPNLFHKWLNKERF